MGVTFPNRLGSQRMKRAHQIPAEIEFLFRFDPFSCHHWWVGRGGPGTPKIYKVAPLALILRSRFHQTSKVRSDAQVPINRIFACLDV